MDKKSLFHRSASPDRYQMLKAYARENRRNSTVAEDVLWRYLREGEMGVKAYRQYVVGDYIADFLFPSVRLIIEVDGAYHSEREQQEDDNIRTAILNRMDYYVLRFRNEEVIHNTDFVLQRIQEILNEIN